MRAAIYARYSSRQQRETSIDDQFRLCLNYINRKGWQHFSSYYDKALTGSTTAREGLQNLLSQAQNGRFAAVVVESLDRLSRDQEHVAFIFKRLSFHGVGIYTLSDERITELHIGLKGTMSALYLKDLADKTRRGLSGKVINGFSASGIAYGYGLEKRLNDQGEIIRGLRYIKENEAEIVREIFSCYASGMSGKSIAKRLNDRNIVGPRTKGWQHTTILGSQKRKSGIINNDLYVGKIVWNRQSWIRNPYSDTRISRLNPQDLWVHSVDEKLRIIEQSLWDEVKLRQQRRHEHL